MFEREKLSGNNFNDRFRQLELVLRVEKKMYVIEQPLPAAPAADSNAQVLVEWNALYDAYNEELKSMFEKQAGVERFDLIQTFYACKQKKGKPVAAYALQMKGYVDQLERLRYMLPQDLIVGLILNGLTKDFVGFVRNYNMHNMGKTIIELRAMLIEYENGLPKKAKTLQVMMIKGGKILKSKKKSHKAKVKGKANGKGKDKQAYIPKNKNPKPAAKEHPTKDDTCHHCKEVGHWKMNYPVYLAELLKKKKQVGFASSLATVQQLTPPYTPQHNGLSERRNHTLLDMVRSMMNLTTLPLSFWDYALESATRILNMVWGCVALVKWDTPDKLQQRFVKCIFIGYPQETIEVSGRAVDLEEIQDEDTSPSEIASKLPMEVKDVMNAEIQSMMDNMVWVLVDLPLGCKSVGSKWIFKKNTDMDGIVHTYKACLVAKGYTQLYEVDYEETLSPVTDIKATRILISIVAFYDYEICQMDVKTAFLNGYLNEDIYMVQTEGFVDPNQPRKASGSNVTFLILYFDDIIIMGNHILRLQSVKDYLEKCFAMKDLREATFILVIKIYKDRSKRLIGLGQNAYMDKILKRYKMDNSKSGHIPMQEIIGLNKTQGSSTSKEVKRMQNVPYASDVGSIIDDTKSQTGYVFILNGGTVDQKSSKQSTTTMCATEAEYIAASEAMIEAVWIRKFISGLGEKEKEIKKGMWNRNSCSLCGGTDHNKRTHTSMFKDQDEVVVAQDEVVQEKVDLVKNEEELI
nr:retrotransposon protein, putative, Ty1-copia subclass [Tanacetum cinerariifolium]